MPRRTSTGKTSGFDPRVPVLIGAILIAGVTGETGADWKECGTGTQDRISACALKFQALPELIRTAVLETGNG